MQNYINKRELQNILIHYSFQPWLRLTIAANKEMKRYAVNNANELHA